MNLLVIHLGPNKLKCANVSGAAVFTGVRPLNFKELSIKNQWLQKDLGMVSKND